MIGEATARETCEATWQYRLDAPRARRAPEPFFDGTTEAANSL
jgi:hypothetical protein